MSIALTSRSGAPISRSRSQPIPLDRGPGALYLDHGPSISLDRGPGAPISRSRSVHITRSGTRGSLYLDHGPSPYHSVGCTYISITVPLQHDHGALSCIRHNEHADLASTFSAFRQVLVTVWGPKWSQTISGAREVPGRNSLPSRSGPL